MGQRVGLSICIQSINQLVCLYLSASASVCLSVSVCVCAFVCEMVKACVCVCVCARVVCVCVCVSLGGTSGVGLRLQVSGLGTDAHARGLLGARTSLPSGGGKDPWGARRYPRGGGEDPRGVVAFRGHAVGLAAASKTRALCARVGGSGGSRFSCVSPSLLRGGCRGRFAFSVGLLPSAGRGLSPLLALSLLSSTAALIRAYLSFPWIRGTRR